MNPYLLVPLAACFIHTALTVAILTRGWKPRVNRLGAALTGAAAFWAVCELLWNSAWDADVALRLVRLSSLGWVFVGPIVFHLFSEFARRPPPLLRRLVPVSYGLAAVLVCIDLTTPWMHPAVVKTSWGWGYTVGPAFPLAHALAGFGVGGGLVLAVSDLRRAGSSGERRQARGLLVGGVVLPLVIASITDGILPMAGWQVPRFGTLSITLLGFAMVWGSHRHGYSLLAPGDFASEILATLPDAVVLLRLDGRIRSVNDGMTRMVGADASSLEGRLLPEIIEGLPERLRGELSERECALVTETGDEIPVSVSTSVLRDKQGAPIGLVLVARDLREVESLRSRLVTSGRLAAVGQLAAGIAHEINNPVAFVRANLGCLRELLERLESKLPSPEGQSFADEFDEGRELVDESLEGVDRVSAIVRDVKSFSHAGSGDRDAVDLNALFDAVLRVASPQLRHCHRIERDFQDVPPARGDTQQLKQVFLNLVINASHAVEGNESIRLATRLEGDRVIAEVGDEGCGIARHEIERIFDPFFTTKPVGEGTGLGLSIAYEIVRSHGGELSVTSEVDRGTRVRVSLPVAAPDA